MELITFISALIFLANLQTTEAHIQGESTTAAAIEGKLFPASFLMHFLLDGVVRLKV